MKQLVVARSFACGLAGVVLLLGGWTSPTKADFAYGFASQTISNLTITPAITALGGVTTSTTASATVNGSGPATSDALDAPQAYLGGAPAAPQNDFARYAPGTPIPVSPVGNFTRGDSQIASLAAPNLASVVAESYINNSFGTRETGDSSITASTSFSLATSSALMITYNYANDAFVTTSGVGGATARYGFDIVIKDSAGNIVFNSTSDNTDITLAAPPNGGEVIRSGTETVTSGVLTAGTTYSLIFSITAGTSALVVPEPSSIVLMGFGGLGVLAMARRVKAKA